MSMREIQNKYGYSRPRVSEMLERLGVKTKRGNHYRQYIHDFNYFEVINTREKAYWLGWLMADGYISRSQRYGEGSVGLALNSSDVGVLEGFKKAIKATNPINNYRYSDSGYNNENTYCRIILKGQKTVDDLIDKGVVYQKSLIKEFPSQEQVPDEFLYDFLRGYFEGNGSIWVHKNPTTQNSCEIGFATCDSFVPGFQERVTSNFKVYHYKDGRQGIMIRLRTKSSKVVVDKMYCDAPEEQILNRKYEKFLEYKNNIK